MYLGQILLVVAYSEAVKPVHRTTVSSMLMPTRETKEGKSKCNVDQIQFTRREGTIAEWGREAKTDSSNKSRSAE
ncbi:hypothetical protein VTI74DRAFT_7270 [Chaetomium olivicolor]